MRGTMVALMAVAALVAAAWTGSAAATETADEQPDAASSGAVRPVDGSVVRHFEEPAHPYGPGHRGVDLAAGPGTTVRAALPGVVTFAGQVALRGWVTVDHGGGLDTTYGVIDPRFVTAGQQVRTGQSLGEVAAGVEHLDWGARLHGTYIDPLRLLWRWRPHLVRLPR